MFQGTTVESVPCFSGRGLFFGTSAEGFLLSNWAARCQLWEKTQENPSFTFRLWVTLRELCSPSCADVLGWLCVEMSLTQMSLWPICVFQEVTRKIRRTSRILLNIYYLKAGAGFAGVTCRLGPALLHQSITNKGGCFGSGGWGIKFTWGAAQPRVELPSWWQLRCGNPCYFPVLLLLFPKMAFFPPILSIESVNCVGFWALTQEQLDVGAVVLWCFGSPVCISMFALSFLYNFFVGNIFITNNHKKEQ